MALGKKSGCLKSKSVVSAADNGLDFGIVRYTRGLGRKRIVISCNEDDSSIYLTPKASSKRPCSAVRTTVDIDKSLLETLPQEILVSSNFCRLNFFEMIKSSHSQFVFRLLFLK